MVSVAAAFSFAVVPFLPLASALLLSMVFVVGIMYVVTLGNLVPLVLVEVAALLVMSLLAMALFVFTFLAVSALFRPTLCIVLTLMNLSNEANQRSNLFVVVFMPVSSILFVVTIFVVLVEEFVFLFVFFLLLHVVFAFCAVTLVEFSTFLVLRLYRFEFV